MRTQEFHPAHNAYARFNAKVAEWVTTKVGSMTTAYCFAGLALIALPSAIKAGPYFIVVWLSSSFLQLVLLPVILTAQNLQATASDARNAQTLADAEYIKNQVNEHTDGGIKAILDAIDRALSGR